MRKWSRNGHSGRSWKTDTLITSAVLWQWDCRRDFPIPRLLSPLWVIKIYCGKLRSGQFCQRKTVAYTEGKAWRQGSKELQIGFRLYWKKRRRGEKALALFALLLCNPSIKPKGDSRGQDEHRDTWLRKYWLRPHFFLQKSLFLI